MWAAARKGLGMLSNTELVSLDKIGKLTITENGVIAEGFDAPGASCRDIAALAAVWGISVLARELQVTMNEPGLSNISVD